LVELQAIIVLGNYSKLFIYFIMKIVQVVHTEERRRRKKKQKKQTNKRTNLRHTQCVNNEIHIGGRQDRHISKLTLDK